MASKTTPPAAAAPAADAPVQVYVRMYRALREDPAIDGGGAADRKTYTGMLGDCFLIRIVLGARTSHILIDCGLLMGSVDAAGRMKKIAQDIIRTTGGTLDGDAVKLPGKLDLLVVTHEHWDHISGFSQANDYLLDGKALEIANLWMAWTEKDDDPQAKRLRAKFDKSGFALAALADRIDRETALQGADKGRTLRSLDGFRGDADTGKKRLQGRDIMGAIKKAAATRAFLEPGTTQRTPAANGGPSLWAYVLGPPRDERLLFKDKPTATGKETYFDSLGIADDILRFATDGGPADPAALPFAPEHNRLTVARLDDKLAKDCALTADEQWIVDHYRSIPREMLLREPPSKIDPAARLERLNDLLKNRAIDDDWLSAAGPLALKLDSDTNNTSLVLAFDLPDGTAMLFAADAQVGNWESWHTHAYADAAGNAQTAEQILNRVRFYKVGHHGSHNATLAAQGLAMMTRDDLVAAIPTDEEFGKQQGGGWKMPNPNLYKALIERTGGRILRNDRRYNAAARANDPDLSGVDPAFFASDRLTDAPLYLEYRVL